MHHLYQDVFALPLSLQSCAIHLAQIMVYSSFNFYKVTLHQTIKFIYSSMCSSISLSVSEGYDINYVASF
jgi:hypothetical protein